VKKIKKTIFFARRKKKLAVENSVWPRIKNGCICGS
jgi:hypothetical protein